VGVEQVPRGGVPSVGAHRLARIHEDRGEKEEARRYYKRFVDYWGEGDLDREQVEEARRKLAELGGA
jgi:hypothetical protein